VESLKLLDYKSNGSLAGEGMTFFLLSRSKNEKSYAAAEIPEMFYKPGNISETGQRISSYIRRKVEHSGNIDLVIMGLNGDIRSDEIYYSLKETVFHGIHVHITNICAGNMIRHRHLQCL
jgi:hypothetical protein